MSETVQGRERIGGGYSRGQRLAETVLMLAFAAGEVALLARLARSQWSWSLAAAALAALVASALLADLVSGMVHWGCDTWGSVETPVLGRVFIRQFREHHVDPDEINRHDLVEANGTNAGLAMLPITLAFLHPFDPAHPTWWPLAYQVGALGFAFFVTFTSQAHQWAHAASPPRWVAALQRTGLMLSKAHHDVHHEAPHLHHYCITGGWMDAALERGKVFRRLEALIQRVTGAVPRGK